MKLNRMQLAVLLGTAFLTGSVITPLSAAYLATVGWVMLLVAAPAFAFLDYRAKRDRP